MYNAVYNEFIKYKCIWDFIPYKSRKWVRVKVTMSRLRGYSEDGTNSQ